MNKYHFGDVQLPMLHPIVPRLPSGSVLEETLELKRFPLDKQVLQSLWIAIYQVSGVLKKWENVTRVGGDLAELQRYILGCG